MHRKFLVICACALAFAVAGRATASAEALSVYTSFTAEELANVMKQFGYRAELATTADGAPEIKSAASGLNYLVLFYDCKTEGTRGCTSIQFIANLVMNDKVPFETINDFNKTTRYGQAMLLADNKPGLHMSLMVDGMTEQNLRRYFGVWESILGDFKKQVKF